MANSSTEENYIKSIFHLSGSNPGGVSTNSIAAKVNTKASSVTDMLKRLADKNLIKYRKYKGVVLTAAGKKEAIALIRKHRLWEVFLVEKLSFKWDEVHDIAEQLEHIQSGELTGRLEKFLKFPKYDPHGDPIPDKHGTIPSRYGIRMDELKENQMGIIVGVRDSSEKFLKYLESIKISLGASVHVKEINEYDKSMLISINKKPAHTISEQSGKNLFVKKIG